MVLKRFLPFLLVLLFAFHANAQIDNLIDQWLEEGISESAIADLSDLAEQSISDPININDTSSLSLLAPLLSPFHIRALRSYIILYGQLLTLDELTFVPGFDSSTIQLISPFIKVEPFSINQRIQLKDASHQIITAIGGTVEKAAGYTDGRYAGDNLHSLFCYTFSLKNRINLRLAADKDPTEAWGHGNYIGFHLLLNNIGPIEQLILGRYNLRFGQGLTLWTGLKPFNIIGRSPERFGVGVCPAGAFNEEQWQQGVATTLRLSSLIHQSLYVSRRSGETLFGSHTSFSSRSLNIGLTAAFTLLDDSLSSADYAYNQARFRGNRQINVGIDMAYQWQRVTLFGEVSTDAELHPAYVAGITVRPSSESSISLSHRSYHRLYHNLHSQGLSSGSNQGENGTSIDAFFTLPLGVRISSSIDLYRFSILRSSSYSPSSEECIRFQAEKSLSRTSSTLLNYTFRSKQRNIPNLDSIPYLSENTFKHLVRAEYRFSSTNLTLRARAVYSHFRSESNTPENGIALILDGRLNIASLQNTLGFSWFNVKGYNARIYSSESYLQYAWSSPMLYGKGLRAYLLLRYNTPFGLTFAAKYSIVYYTDRSSIGSGAAQTEGPYRQTYMLQIKYSL